MRFTRRRALQGLSAAALSPLMNACASPSTTTPTFSPALVRARIDTIVFVMMENRSFDHVFGARRLLDGRSDIDGLVDGMSNPDLSGAAVAIHPADLDCVVDPPHGWDASHLQWNAGANDGFVQAHQRSHGDVEAHRVMGYLTSQQLTTSSALADSGALCQRWFASVMGPTWPNRYYFLAASSHGLQGNKEFLPDGAPTIFRRLDDADVPWANYYGNIPFAVTTGVELNYPEVGKHERFFADAAAGTLPPVVVIDPVYGKSDDHPPTHPLAGQVFLQTIYNALARSPQWNRCLLVVTYDEHGGFFDHVPPPTVQDDFADAGFTQLGFRVPSFVVGPFVKRGLVSDTVFDHSSIYKTLSTLFALPAIGARDAHANDLLSLLDEQRIVDDDPLPPVELAPIDASDDVLFAPECRGVSFHAAPVDAQTSDTSDVPGASTASASITGQPELEELFATRYPERAAMLRADTDAAWRHIVDQAVALGALQRRT